MNMVSSQKPELLPNDRRGQFGAQLFLLSLLVFFVSSILLYVIYAASRIDDPQTREPLPRNFLVSTVCLIVISGLMHWSTRTVRRERLRATSTLLGVSAVAAIFFMAVQFYAMQQMLAGPALRAGPAKGVAGMVFVLAFLHALHVAGGVISLGIVSTRSLQGRYDHERHWPVDFAAQYWHFLDVIWICMIATFWYTTGGFGL